MIYRARPQDGIAFVTGASSGIGRATALELAKRGFTVAATARRLPELESLVKEGEGLSGRIIAYPGDVTDQVAMHRLVDTIEAVQGPIVLAFLNAGISPYMRAQQIDIEAFQQVMDVNVMGVVKVLSPLLTRMAKHKKGQVAINASVAGYGGLPQAAAYGASKAACIYLCEALKLDCDLLNIRLQVVNPGFVDTPLTRKNTFPMPFLMDMPIAARRVCDGFERGGFEITFPKRLSYGLKMLNLLPYPVYFFLVGLTTGWRGKRE
jgi:NAD(P)-dependent dehydrogenase (short-subunit alcohol dehydrogenase family)